MFVIRYVIATFFNAGGSWGNSVQHNTVHRNLVPWTAAPKDPCLPQVPPRFPGLLHLYHQRFVIDWRLHIYSCIKVDEMGKHNNQKYGFLGPIQKSGMEVFVPLDETNIP